MADQYNSAKDRFNAGPYPFSGMPARGGQSIDAFKSDSLDLTNPSNPAVGGAVKELPCYPTKLFVGGSGNISVILVEDFSNGGQGTALTFSNVSGWIPLQIRRLCSTGTTATGVVGLWD